VRQLFYAFSGRAGGDGIKGNMADAWLLANYPEEFARALACGVTDYKKQKTDE